MKLIEIFNQLTYGELSQLHIGGEEVGEIRSQDYMAIVPHINLGLTALHKRFLIREGRLRIELQPGIYTYVLHSEHAVSHRASRKTRYILDSADLPFEDDIIKVERVYTDKGNELNLNDESDPYSITTLSMNTLRVPPEIVEQELSIPDAVKTTTLEVVYRANHPIITEDNGGEDPEDAEIDLPYTYLEALLYFVAARMHTPVGLSNEFHTGNDYLAKFEAECRRLEEQSLRVDRINQNTRLRRNGWP